MSCHHNMLGHCCGGAQADEGQGGQLREAAQEDHQEDKHRVEEEQQE